MTQLVLAALVALAAQPAPPSDGEVLAALPPSESARAEVLIVKSRVGPRAEGRWSCVVYSTQGAGGAKQRRVEVVYLGPGRR
jgi:hypothetical protein